MSAEASRLRKHHRGPHSREGQGSGPLEAQADQPGKYMGIPPTGNRVNFRGISIYRIEGGQIAESWSVSDLLGMMQQLGAIGELGPAQGA